MSEHEDNTVKTVLQAGREQIRRALSRPTRYGSNSRFEQAGDPEEKAAYRDMERKLAEAVQNGSRKTQ